MTPNNPPQYGHEYGGRILFSLKKSFDFYNIVLRWRLVILPPFLEIFVDISRYNFR